MRCVQGNSHAKGNSKWSIEKKVRTQRPGEFIKPDTCGPFSVPDVNGELYSSRT